jgi:tetratricopeptide (TPR) repeat protein
VLSWQGQHEEAIGLARRAVEVDPHSGLMAMNLSYMFMDFGDLEKSIELARETLRLHPDLAELYGNLWLTYLRAGRSEDASATLVEWAALTGRDAEAAREVGKAFIRHGQTGEPQELSSELLDRVEFGSEDLGQVYAFVGDSERTLRALEKAYDERSGSRSVLSMKLNPGYDFIRTDPRFVSLMQRVGLAP